LLFIRTLNDPINVPKLALLIVGVTIVAVLRTVELLQGASHDTLKQLIVPAGAVVAPLFIAMLFSPYRWWALFGHYPRFIGLVPYVFAAALGILTADAFARDVRPVAWAVAGSGAVAGFYAVLQFAGLDPFDWTVKGAEAERVVASTLGNPNFAGAFLAMAAPVALGLAFVDEKRWIALGLTSCALVGLAVTTSQAAWVAAVAGVVIVCAGRFEGRVRWAGAAALVVTAGLALVVAGSVLAAIAGVDRVPETIGRRGEWWVAAARMTQAYPVVGRGPNAFALEHPRFRTIEDGSQVGLDITDDPHSVLLSFGTSAGALGVFGYLTFAGWGVATAGRRGTDMLSRAFAGAFIAYLLQGLVSVDTVALRAVGWTCLGALVAAVFIPITDSKWRPRVQRKAKRRNEPLRAIPAVAAVGLVGLFLISVGVRLFSSDAAFAQANRLFLEGDVAPAQESYERAISFRGDPVYRRTYGNRLGAVAVAVEERGEPLIREAREQFAFVEELPHVNSIVDYAKVMIAWSEIDPGAAEVAVDLYRRAVELDPRDPALLADASSFLIAAGEYEAAIAALSPIVDDFGRAELWGALALAHANLDEREEATAAIDKALALSPGDALALQAQQLLHESR